MYNEPGPTDPSRCIKFTAPMNILSVCEIQTLFIKSCFETTGKTSSRYTVTSTSCASVTLQTRKCISGNNFCANTDSSCGSSLMDHEDGILMRIQIIHPSCSSNSTMSFEVCGTPSSNVFVIENPYTYKVHESNSDCNSIPMNYSFMCQGLMGYPPGPPSLTSPDFAAEGVWTLVGGFIVIGVGIFVIGCIASGWCCGILGRRRRKDE